MILWSDDITYEEKFIDYFKRQLTIYNPQYLWSNPKQTQQIPQALKRSGRKRWTKKFYYINR